MTYDMARQNSHRLTCDIDRDTIEKLDSIVEQDNRFWNRTHLLNEALSSYVTQWEESREDPPVEDMTEEVEAGIEDGTIEVEDDVDDDDDAT